MQVITFLCNQQSGIISLFQAKVILGVFDINDDGGGGGQQRIEKALVAFASEHNSSGTI